MTRRTDGEGMRPVVGYSNHPGKITMAQYEDDLLRQNSLIYDGWRVFRWTDRQLAPQPEQVKEELALFLERIPGLLEFDDFLPKQLRQPARNRLRGCVTLTCAHAETASVPLGEAPRAGAKSGRVLMRPRDEPIRSIGEPFRD